MQTEEDYLKRPPRFEANRNEDFQLWALRFEVLAEAKDCMDVLRRDAIGDSEIPELTEAVQKKVVKARALLVMCLGSKALRTVVADRNNPFCMYKKLTERYATKTAASRVQLQTELYQMRYDAGKVMSEYIDNFENTFLKLDSMECSVPDSLQVAMLLASFGNVDESPYGPVISALQTLGEDSLTWETVTARLLLEHNSRIRNGISSRSVNASGEDSDKTQARALKSFAKVRCFKCKRFGHFKRDCKSGWANTNHRAQDDGNKNNNHRALIVKRNSVSSEMIVDSGASAHMVYHRSLLSDFQPVYQTTITVGDGRKLHAKGKGSVIVSSTVSNGETVTLELKDVLFVPGMDSNLLSCAELTKEKYRISFDGSSCAILDEDDRLAGLGKLRDGIYVIGIAKNRGAKYAFRAERGLGIWHHRFGHVDKGAISSMREKRSVNGLEEITPSKGGANCEHCMRGKLTKLSLKSRLHKPTSPGEVIYTDVCGPLPVQSIGGARYFVSFTDGYSGFKAVAVIKKKSDVHESFIKFCVEFERQFDCTVKVLYSDRGGEFQALDKYLEENGIVHECTAAYTPQQNGVAERLNRTLLDMVRSMLSECGLPPNFWAEALSAAVGIRNMTATRNKEWQTPLELLSGRKPDVRHLRVFGSEAWTHVMKRKKLDDKGRRGIVLNCLPRGIYRIWDISKRSVHELRHVIINETVFPALEWGKKTGEQDPFYAWFRTLGLPEILPNEGSTSGSTDDETEVEGAAGDVIEPHPETENDDVAENAVVSSTEQVSPIDVLTHFPVVESTHGESRFPTRERREPVRYGSANTAVAAQHFIPKTVREALGCADRGKWQIAIDSEIEALVNKDTWQVIADTGTGEVIETRFVFDVKKKQDGTVDRYKARLVARGFQELDDCEVYAPVIDFTTVRVAAALALRRGYTIHQIDVRTAFLNGKLPSDSELCVRPPSGIDMNVPPGHVLKLNRALYGLKRAPRIWNTTFNCTAQEAGFRRLLSDECVYEYGEGTAKVYIFIYVDDILVVGNHSNVLAVKDILLTLFEMRDLGEVSSFLGVKFNLGEGKMFLSQELYTKTLLQRFGMENAKATKTPLLKSDVVYCEQSSHLFEDLRTYKAVIGGLLFLAQRTRPDIASSVGLLARMASSPTVQAWTGLKRVMRYLVGTAHLGLEYDVRGKDEALVMYCDADWAGDQKDRKSTSGFVIFLYGCPVVWYSKKQGCVAMSTSEAEFIAISDGMKEAKWMIGLLEELECSSLKPVPVFEDNTGAIKWSTSDKRAKHVDLRYHFVKKLVEDGLFEIRYCSTMDMIADVFTKPLPTERFITLRTLLHVTEETDEPLRRQGEDVDATRER